MHTANIVGKMIVGKTKHDYADKYLVAVDN